MMIQMKTVIKKLSNPARALASQKYFKTGPGQYAEGDVFIGLTNPQCREIAKQFKSINFNQVQQLIKSKIHQQRFIALLILIQRFKSEKQKVYEIYLQNLQFVNNWDLVDLSAPSITGVYLSNKTKQERKILYDWVQSPNIWHRRISIISTLTFIRMNQFDDCLKISNLLLKDKHDLIHKAVGWMLREVGKRNVNFLQTFLKQNYEQLHRTTLRYAIQKFDSQKRKYYLKGQFNKE